MNLSVKWHLWQWLYGAIVHSIPFSSLLGNLPSSRQESLMAQGLPAHWLEDQVICYGCVLPRQSARDTDQKVEEQMDQLVELLHTFRNTISLDSYLQNLTVKRGRSGWIHLCMSSIGLAIWLKKCLEICQITENCQSPPPTGQMLEIPLNSTQLTVISAAQYRYARCGALLRLAQQQRWEWNEISWLNSTGQLRSSLASEWQLIFQLMQVADGIPVATQAQRVRLLGSLSQALAQFDRDCRIFDPTDLALSQTRLGLVAITQVWLRSLLTQGLQQLAPAEL